jgi:DNA repair exonuclease SbcCD nuclease subunit
MQRLRAAAIPVFIVSGNHDAASQITRSLRLPENVTTFSTRRAETVVIEELGVAIHGQGYARRAVTEDLSRGYPQGDPQLFNIGMLHTSLDGKPGHESYAPCSVAALRAKGYQYWALGHVHRREIVSEEPWIVFPGNIQGRHIRETGSKGCTLVSVDNRQVQDVEQRDLDVMRWLPCELDITSCADLDDCYAQVRNSLQQALDEADGRPVALRLILLGKTPLHAQLHAQREQLTQEVRALCGGLAGAGVWLEKITLQTEMPRRRDDTLSDDALGGLLRAISDLETEGAAAALLDELAPLESRLPAELRSGVDGYDPTDQRQLSQILEDVKELLLNRLLAAESDG